MAPVTGGFSRHKISPARDAGASSATRTLASFASSPKSSRNRPNPRVTSSSVKAASEAARRMRATRNQLWETLDQYRVQEPPRVHASAGVGVAFELPVLCYYPGCFEVVRPLDCVRCKECSRGCCIAHLMLCGSCKQPICADCMRGDVYRNVTQAITDRGPSAAVRMWLAVLTNVSMCPRCAFGCAGCGLPGLVDGRFTCKVCWRNVCGSCVHHAGGKAEMVCRSCYVSAVSTDREAAIALVALRSGLCK